VILAVNSAVVLLFDRGSLPDFFRRLSLDQSRRAAHHLGKHCEPGVDMQTSVTNSKNYAQKIRRVAVAGENHEQAAYRPSPGANSRSSEWFNNPHNPGMTALYLERYLNYGPDPARSLQIRQADHRPSRRDRQRPSRHAIAITSNSPTGSGEGIRAAGGIAMEFPMHPIQETGKASDRGARSQPRLSWNWSKSCSAYPLDGVVLTTGCDTRPPPPA